MEYLLGILVIVLAGVLGVAIRRALSQRRSDQLRSFARTLGYEYSPTDDGSVLAILRAFPLFKKAHTRLVDNVMRKDSPDCRVIICDYEHEDYSPAYHYDPRKRFRSRQTVTIFSPVAAQRFDNAQLQEARQAPAPNPMMCIESDGTRWLIYEPNILYPADDLAVVIDQRKKLYEEKTRNSEQGPPAYPATRAR